MIIDFHIHTHHSYDSLMKPEKIIKIAKKKGLTGIVVCDHNTIKGGLEVQKINRDKNFQVIVGAEIATNVGDITGIFLTKEIQSRNFETVVEEIKKQNGLVILNHPYKAHQLDKIDFSKIDFIEGYNSRLNKELNQKAVALAKKYNKPIIAGSDAHLYSEIGKCKTYLNNLSDLKITKTDYSPSSQFAVMISQFIKAFKKRNFKIFVSAVIVTIKHYLRLNLK